MHEYGNPAVSPKATPEILSGMLDNISSENIFARAIDKKI